MNAGKAAPGTAGPPRTGTEIPGQASGPAGARTTGDTPARDGGATGAPEAAGAGPTASEATATDPTAAGARGPARVTLRADLRASVWDGLLALVVTAAVFALIYARIEAKTSSTVTVMPFMADAGGFWVYFLSQAFGWSALLWAWGTVIIGLLLSGTRPAWLRIPGPKLERLHRTTSINTMALMAAHAIFFAVELVRHDKDAWHAAAVTAFIEAFVPGGYDSGTGKVAIPVGQAALYLAIPMGLLFYARHRIGPKTWRVMHRFVIVTYVLSVWHTLLYGTNVWYDGAFRTTIWLLQLPIAVLLLIRLARPARRSERLRGLAAHPGSKAGWGLRLAGRVLAVGLIVLVLAVVVSGRDGGREKPPADTSSTHDHG
ncbi:ferric reductase-like transmembrane domain-containing protein [Streptomyces sp. NPDC057638]|uniref:ferric reductase-like transmembrane domain-containing protein n=1 Tax=Streptomyces sp. NPDC057638 TaxID=3346190 RepID=UPI00367504AA